MWREAAILLAEIGVVAVPALVLLIVVLQGCRA